MTYWADTYLKQLSYGCKLNLKLLYSLKYNILNVLISYKIAIWCIVLGCYNYMHVYNCTKMLRILAIYIYIYSHPLTDCFVLSELFSVARHIGGSKPGSKPIQLYLRLSLKPPGQQAYHVWLREFLRYYVVTAAAAASVCLRFYTLSATSVCVCVCVCVVVGV